MNVRFFWTILLLSSLPLPARAGVRYRYETATSGGLVAKSHAGSVTTEGDRARIETKTAEMESVRLWSESGRSCVHLDPGRGVHYKSGCGLDEVLRITLRSETAPSPKVKKVKVDAKDEGSGGIVAGLAVRKGTIETSFVTDARMGNETFPVRIKRRLEVWMTDRFVVPAFALGHLNELATGVPEVDDRVAAALKALGTFPLRFVITTTKAFDENHPVTETLTTTLSEIEETSPDATTFEVPAGYRYEAPVIRAPGGGS